ncbi:D-alanyl-D-alanine carboxypeptidase, partial [Butyricicoccus sp. 1XD8-22]
QPKLILETDTMEAEVKEGTVVGKVVIERTEGTDYGYINGDGFTADVVTTETVERASGFSLFFQAIGGFFASIWNGITGFVGGLFS